jgi:hypothetical protein
MRAHVQYFLLFAAESAIVERVGSLPPKLEGAVHNLFSVFHNEVGVRGLGRATIRKARFSLI